MRTPLATLVFLAILSSADLSAGAGEQPAKADPLEALQAPFREVAARSAA